jgi:hypothetical protein
MTVFQLETSPRKSVVDAHGHETKPHTVKNAWQQRSFEGRTQVVLKGGTLKFLGEQASVC